LKIAESCGNPVIPIIIQPIYDFMPKINSMIYANITHVKSTAQETHRRIVEMILTQNGQGAFEVMTEHMKLAEEHSNAMLAAMKDDIV